MSSEDRPRLVSGEIMAGPSARPQATRRGEAVADAEYEAVATPAKAQPARFPAAKPAIGMDFLKAGTSAAADSSRKAGPLFWAFGLALVALAFWISGGHTLARQHVAALAPALSSGPLHIAGVTSRVERHNARDILFVDGRAENRGPETQTLPPFEIIVSANDGSTTRYFLGTNDTALAPGERYAFSSRLEAPTNGVKSVSVTFREVQP